MSVDEGSVRDLPGFVKVVVRKNFVGVVAEKQTQAIACCRRSSRSSGRRVSVCRPSKSFYDYIRKQPSRDVLLVDSQDVEQKLAQAATVLKATYCHPYQASRIDWRILRGGRCERR